MAFNGDAFDKLDRLRAMTAKGQQTWDLSPKDVAAIQMAVDVLELLVHADRSHNGDLEMYDVDDAETPKMLCVGSSDEHYGETAFECFVKGAESLRLLNASST
jgi:hypothetical protein